MVVPAMDLVENLSREIATIPITTPTNETRVNSMWKEPNILKTKIEKKFVALM
jgi:hypothetical protein